ncbi:MAG: heme ABC transporter ATP-binding protein CcmA [Gammaproteobacteria bacterium]|nr:MAG: heme ABC transporter ATP-binding protein CcmA [Gammaproteobacteria bacterium]
MDKINFQLEVKNLSCIRSDKLLFKNLSFVVRNYNLLEITGKNGSGKTSLLKILSALRLPDEGEIIFNGQNINTMTYEYYSYVSFLGHHNAIKNDLTAIENLSISCALSSSVDKENDKDINSVLTKVELLYHKDDLVGTFSAGMKRRLSIAKLLLLKNPLWILDEPYTSVDLSGIDLIESFITSHLKQGGAVVMTSHHPLKIDKKYIKNLHIK